MLEELQRRDWPDDWVVYAKPLFGGPNYVLHYLARHTHRVAIANHRLVTVTEDRVIIESDPARPRRCSRVERRGSLPMSPNVTQDLFADASVRDATDGGYKHGEVKFSQPLQVRLRQTQLDTALLEALVKADASASSLTLSRLVLPFVALANTDDELMDELTEAILMASAFEQPFNANGEKRTLTERIRSTVQSLWRRDSRQCFEGEAGHCDRPKQTGARCSAADVVGPPEMDRGVVRRSRAEICAPRRTRCPQVGVDSVCASCLAAFTFPLAVKLLLSKEGHYTITDGDVAKCKAVDRLLVADRWNSPENENFSQWQRILMDTKQQELFHHTFTQLM